MMTGRRWVKMKQPHAVTALTSSGRATPWLARGLVGFLGVWCAGVTILLVLLQQNATEPAARAIARMAIGLVIVWIIGGGTLSLSLRRPARRWLQRYARHWQLVFVLSVTGMALLEEAITTGTDEPGATVGRVDRSSSHYRVWELSGCRAPA